MDNEQLIDDILHDVIEHYGVLGMKWGVRKSAASGDSTKANSKKITEMSNAELEAYSKRLKLETSIGTTTAQQYKDATAILAAAAIATTAVVTISKNTATIMGMIA